MGDAGTRKSVKTADGVTLSYIEAGTGAPLVIIPGWSQTAEQFKGQIEGLSDRYRVIALDMRGHGQSDKPENGYRIARLATDVHDVIEALDLQDVNILGQSMGCSVIWCYWELFCADRLARLILVDQMPYIVANSAWSDEEKLLAGAIFTPDTLEGVCNALAGPDGEQTTRDVIGSMVTSAMSPETLEWMIQCNLQMPRRHAATLLYHHSHHDWRDTIPLLRLPTLVVGGRASLIPWQSIEWTANQIPGAKLEIFEEDEGGQHFLFVENPEKFNRVVADFVG